MKVLILGGTGMLGHKLVQAMTDRFETWTTIRGAFRDVEYTGIFDRERTIENIDVREFKALEDNIRLVQPDVVVNAVGVIKQVPAHRDVAELITINSILPHQLAEMGRRIGFRLILMSTDCVFSGRQGNYVESDPTDAQDIYGRSKLLGEVTAENCLTLRTSIIGRELASSHSLTEWFLNQAPGPIRGYTQAIYSGFPTIVFAAILVDVITGHSKLNGVFHLSSDPISKCDLLRLINEKFRLEHDIIPDESVVIDRSLNSDYFRKATGFIPLSWPEMIMKMATDRTQYDSFRPNAVTA